MSDAPFIVNARLQRTEWHDIYLADDTEWISDELLPTGKQTHLFGPSGVGKSLLALHLALAVVEGTPALGALKAQQGTVMWLDYENGPSITKERIEAYGHTDEAFAWFGTRFYMYCFPDLDGLDTLAGMIDLKREVDRVQPDLVVIDSMGLAVEGEENSADTYRDLGRHTGSMLRSSGITTLMLDNTGKSPERGSRGSSRKKDEADIQWGLTESGIDTFTLTNHKDRIGGCPKALSIHQTWNGHLGWDLQWSKMLSADATRVVRQIEA